MCTSAVGVTTPSRSKSTAPYAFQSTCSTHRGYGLTPVAKPRLPTINRTVTCGGHRIIGADLFSVVNADCFAVVLNDQFAWLCKVVLKYENAIPP